jgi:uncharacterized membrane protein
MPKSQPLSAKWLYPLLGSLAVFAFVAIAVYVLTSMWRERTAAATTDAPAEETPTATILTLQPLEILDRRLAAGEITIEEYDEITAVLNRRFVANVWSGPERAAV